MLKIDNLHVTTQGQDILKGLSLEVKPGEVHAIMGPNGSGKSTLAKSLAGHPDYEVEKGKLSFEINKNWVDLGELEPHERAQQGIFLGYQYPMEIPGVTNGTFLQESFNAICQAQGADELDPFEFKELVTQKAELLALDQSFLQRPVNEGFSGGEKKKNEILQLLLLNPRLAVLDETDSGLDIDALKIVAGGVNSYKNRFNATILITHYQRLLDYIVPDYVHIIADGKIVRSGDKSLALELEKHGYDILQ